MPEEDRGAGLEQRTARERRVLDALLARLEARTDQKADHLSRELRSSFAEMSARIDRLEARLDRLERGGIWSTAVFLVAVMIVAAVAYHQTRVIRDVVRATIVEYEAHRR